MNLVLSRRRRSQARRMMKGTTERPYCSSPWWVANNVTGTSTVRDGTKNPAADAERPRRRRRTSSSRWREGVPAKFIFASLDGKISGLEWGRQPERGRRARRAGSVYIALAIHGDTLYSPNFASLRGRDIPRQLLRRHLRGVRHAGGFEDDSVPTGYCPFGIQAIGDSIFVTYAKSAGRGRGARRRARRRPPVRRGRQLRLESREPRPFNSPWGMAMAPADWGRFSGCLIVGNFGDGMITAWCEKKREKKWRFAGYLRGKGPKI